MRRFERSPLAGACHGRRRPRRPPHHHVSSLQRNVASVELGDRFDPVQGVVLVGLAEMRHLRSDSSPNRWRTGIRHDETQFAQASRPPPLTHHPHSFRRCRHVAPRLAGPMGHTERNALRLRDQAGRVSRAPAIPPATSVRVARAADIVEQGHPVRGVALGPARSGLGERRGRRLDTDCRIVFEVNPRNRRHLRISPSA